MANCPECGGVLSRDPLRVPGMVLHGPVGPPERVREPYLARYCLGTADPECNYIEPNPKET